MRSFILEQQLIPATLGIVFGITTEKVLERFMTAFLVPYLRHLKFFNHEINQLIIALVELVLVFTTTLLLIRFLIIPLLQDERTEEEERLREWNKFMIQLNERDSIH